jgi:hypothetical protein
MKHSLTHPSFRSAFKNSGSPIEDGRFNIAHCRDRLKTEIEPFSRIILHELLAEEEAKLARHIKLHLVAKTPNG